MTDLPAPTAPEVRDVLSLMPADTPEYMAPAWLGLIRYLIGQPEAFAAYRRETGCTYRPPKNGLEAQIDAATGADWEFLKRFVAWVNVNHWGPMDGPEDAI